MPCSRGLDEKFLSRFGFLNWPRAWNLQAMCDESQAKTRILGCVILAPGNESRNLVHEFSLTLWKSVGVS